MGTTERSVKPLTRGVVRLRPHFDRLEFRLAMSGSTINPGTLLAPWQVGRSTSGSLSVVSTDPVSLEVLTQSPSSLLVKFDRPLDDFSLGNADFALRHLASDGTVSPLGLDEALLSEALDGSDPTGGRISITLSKPLANGRYQLVLVGKNQLLGADGTSVAGDGSDHVLSEFTVASPIAGITGATPLPAVGSTELVQSGLLDLSGNPNAVQYYRLTLGPGHHWRLGLEVASNAGQGGLASSLSLFDSTGALVATNPVGSTENPGDPDLFAGLDPGTYYVGISAEGNVPNSAGVYEPGTSSISASEGGAFQLHVVADVADQPAQVLGLRVDHADPLSTSPTGLTIQFSGALQPDALQYASTPSLVVVDQEGVRWPLTPTIYQANLGQLSLLVNQALPPGSYKLELTGNGGLVDLAGLKPVAAGLAPGELGTFVVAPAQLPAGDLGPIYPQSGVLGLKSALQAAANGTTSTTFVVLESGVYAVKGIGASSGVTVNLVDATGNSLDIGRVNGSGELSDLILQPGQYTLMLTNPGPVNVELALDIFRKATEFSSLVEGGVAQGSALNLRLVSPQANFGQGSGASSSLTNNPTIVSNSVSAGASTSGPSTVVGLVSGANRVTEQRTTIAVGLSTPTATSFAGLLYGLARVGPPSSQNLPTTAAKMSGSTGSSDLGLDSSGLPGGLRVVPLENSSGGGLEPGATPLEPEPSAQGVVAFRRGSTLEAGLLSRPKQSSQADDQSLVAVDWLHELLSISQGLLRQAGVTGETSGEASIAMGPVALPDGSVQTVDESRVKAASLASPIGIGVALGAIIYRYRTSFSGKSRQLGKENSRLLASPRPILVGIHQRSRKRAL